MTKKRIDKINYYLNICEALVSRGTCLRKNYASLIIKNDEIVSTGYTGSPRGCVNCCDIGTCKREELGIPSGERYELCRSVHAEMNAIISASRESMIGSTLFLVGIDAKTGKILDKAEPCLMCKKMIINSGITTVVMRWGKDYKVEEVVNWKILDQI